MEIIRAKPPEVVEERGILTRILDTEEPIHSILYITSKAGSTRSNHYHKQDTHYCYIISGKAEWHEKPVEGGPDASGGAGQEEVAVLEAGDMIRTPPNVIHAVKFLEDTVFLAFSTQPRNREHYEEDTVRVKLIE